MKKFLLLLIFFVLQIKASDFGEDENTGKKEDCFKGMGSQEVELGDSGFFPPQQIEYDVKEYLDSITQPNDDKSIEEQLDFYSKKVAEMLEASKDARDHEAMMENLQSDRDDSSINLKLNPNQTKTPLSAFSAGVKFLPQEIRREAWAHYEQAENTKQIETVKDAQNLAKLYQDKAMAKDSKNSDYNTNTDSGCIIN